MSSEGVFAVSMGYTFTTILILGMWTIDIDSSEKTQIPQHLLECYQSPPPFLLPMNLETMIEIMRKISSGYYTPTSLNQQISDVLNWFSIDGLERSPNVVNIKNVIPFSRSGFQALKQDLLFERLIPIQRRAFEAYSLSQSEKCTFHLMLSTSVNYWQRGDEAKICPESPQQFRNMSADGSGGAGMYSVCPIETGVVLTPAGSVNVGRLLTAMLAALTPQQIPLSQLLTTEQLILCRLLPTDTINNVWAATLAGDLAEAAVEQSPLYEMNVKIRIPGRWNNTQIPTHFYFDKVPFDIIDKHQWQITDAEILGGIDGLLLGRKVQKPGISETNTQQLSQVLEMYYSNSTVTEDHVCKRKSAFNNLMERDKNTLTEQTIRFAALLSLKITTYFTDSSIMAYRCINAVGRFLHYYSHLLGDRTCPREGTIVPRINLFVILDATWPPYSTLQFLMLLIQNFDISYYGGRITVINGDSALVRVNSTSNPSTLYQNMYLGSQNDPKELRLHNSFTALKDVLEVENEREKTSPYPRSSKQNVVVVCGYSSTIRDKDMYYAEDILTLVKSRNPEVQFVYVASTVNAGRFQQFLKIGGVSSSDEVISSEDSAMGNIVNRIKSAVRSDRSLKPAYCTNKLLHQWPEVWYNEYITPRQTHVFWIHPDYFYRSLDIVKINFKTYNSGELRVCMSRGAQKGDCKNVVSDSEVTHAVLRPCGASCEPLYFTVNVLKTHNTCTESECRFLSQVKFSIIVQDLHCIKLNADIHSMAHVHFSLYTVGRSLMFVLSTLIVYFKHSLLGYEY
ncbi:uncharacterized protein LOC128989201 [Macrosteles quadrilineatus]|uniref:uncharacterized protein LOC128989201 n=1 Tax=Macrosteles quadrilineatus TaxID=74068 RepID=UPI0023E18A44|nr:uncharacterized protein LOC128989201 [Macrosteles quadrilineatus]